MNGLEADQIAECLTRHLAAGEGGRAYEALRPRLQERTPFRLLERIAVQTEAEWPETSALLELIATDGCEGGWVVIGSSLRKHYPARPALMLNESRRYIILADKWYGADILGERVPGPALVDDFDQARTLLLPWRSDDNRWVRRSVGVAVHFWAKRSRGDPLLQGKAQELMNFLEPMFEDWDLDAVKGVGWGLKTLGKVYPCQLGDWLLKQSGRPHRRLMLRKAATYLTDEQRRDVFEAYGL